MNNTTAIGFDLFNTLITVEPQTLSEAMDRLIGSLSQSGFHINEENFIKTYREVSSSFIGQARENGRETHNSIWISATLGDGGKPVSPEDTRIGKAVESYFSAFYDNCHLIPGTKEMLRALQSRYPLGLLSNFTHGPAAREILKRTGLLPYFKTILISGELGFRKPHPMVFEKLVERLGTDKDRTIYIGDDPAPDIHGAKEAGLRPIWSTIARDSGIPLLPGILKRSLDQPEFEIPTISSWHDLFLILELY